MRITLSIIAAISSLTLASASSAGVRLEPAAADSFVHFVGAAKKATPQMSFGKFKANGGRVKDTFPAGCTGDGNIDRCTQFCIESASGNICVDDVACFHNGERVDCPPE